MENVSVYKASNSSYKLLINTTCNNICNSKVLIFTSFPGIFINLQGKGVKGLLTNKYKGIILVNLNFI